MCRLFDIVSPLPRIRNHTQWCAEIGGRSLGTLSFITDALGRSAEFAGSVTDEHIYGPLGEIALLSAPLNTNGALYQAYIPLPGGAQAVYNASGVIFYGHVDWLGTSRLATTPSRTVYFDQAYAPYGESYERNISPPDYPVEFAEMFKHTASGYYDTPNREYHPVQGRWISPDPAGRGAVSMGDPQTWNRYAYVGNSPLKAVDPSGLFRSDNNTGHNDWDVRSGGAIWIVNGMEMPATIAQALLSGGAAVQCPNNVCNGFNDNGQYLQYWAFATGGGYYAYSGPGALYYSAAGAGAAAAIYLYALGKKDLHEYSSNVYEDGNDVFSYSKAQQGPYCPVKCSWTPDFNDVPAGTHPVGNAHNHPAGGHGDTSFSNNDISAYLLIDRLGFLGTRPGDRVLMFDPALYDSWAAGGVSPVCVLQGAFQNDYRPCH